MKLLLPVLAILFASCQTRSPQPLGLSSHHRHQSTGQAAYAAIPAWDAPDSRIPASGPGTVPDQPDDLLADPANSPSFSTDSAAAGPVLFPADHPEDASPTNRTASGIVSAVRPDTALSISGNSYHPDRTASPLSTAGSGGRYYDRSYRPAVGDHKVSGYYRRDGTYVRPHRATDRDDSFWNNYSSQGNLNPYTGHIGTRTPASGGYSGGTTYVRGYYRKDGTYVRGHTRRTR